MFFSLGLILALGAINIYIKDTEYIVAFIINMMFYATSIIYPTTLFPKQFRWILSLNPMTHMIDAYRSIFMYHQFPELSSVLYMVFCAFIFFVIGLLIFRKLEKGFAEEV